MKITDLASTDVEPKARSERQAPVGAKPAFNANDIRDQLRSYDRTPFLDVLADWLMCAPSVDAIVALAEKSPDKYIVAVSSLSKVAGFSERRELSVDMHVTLKKLSDSQLEDRLNVLADKLGINLNEMKEVKLIESDVPSQE